ncbi:hypothetical protein M422DRAFT_244866 [Sphaerobolus stellatus SS14]|nr:hypothetical protein M422DRAFT_244866 [Sphaerobolus stellatus SS14]
MIFTANRVTTKFMRQARDEQTPCPNCGYSGSSKPEPIADRAEMLDSEDMAW